MTVLMWHDIQKTKSKAIKGIPVMLDYWHLWIDKLKRCVQDKAINTNQNVIALQKKKLGLLRLPRYDTSLGPEAYYKGKVMELHKQFGELTFPCCKRSFLEHMIILGTIIQCGLVNISSINAILCLID